MDAWITRRVAVDGGVDRQADGWMNRQMTEL